MEPRLDISTTAMGPEVGTEQEQQNKIMYINFRRGVPRPWGNGTVTPLNDGVIPVEMLFNENSSSGEVMPLSDGTVRLRGENGAVSPLSIQKGENIVVGHEDLEETGAQILKLDSNKAWALPAEERNKYVNALREYGDISEDDLADLRSRADMFGMEALTESEQMLVDGLDGDTLLDVQDFMRQTGMDKPGYDPMNYQTYGDTETGRFIQVELKDHPGQLLDMYEAPPSGDRHVLWNMHDTPGVPNFTSVEEGSFELKGVYEGRPFEQMYQTRVQQHADSQALMFGSMTAAASYTKPYEPSREDMDDMEDMKPIEDMDLDAPDGQEAAKAVDHEATAPAEPRRFSAVEMMRMAADEVDKREAEKQSLEDGVEGPDAVE